jgi:hypothetical protein
MAIHLENSVRRFVLRSGLLLSLLSLLMGAPSGVLILCNGADGHVALELAQPEAAPAAVDVSAVSTLVSACYCDAGCGPCEDNELGLSPTISRSSERRALDAPASLHLPGFAALEPLTRMAAHEITQAAMASLPAMCSHLEQTTIRLLV